MKRLFYIVRQTAYTVFSFVCFLGMALELTVRGFFMLTVQGKTNEHKRQYHQLLQRRLHFAITHVPGTTYTVCNEPRETFDKPAVIVCNHQSHLDLAAIMMLAPNLIILTKDWVWRNPFYGIIIRYADYFPVSETEQMAQNIAQMVDKGYSVVIFPEGSRSPDCTIRRFHRGAFYMAEQLNLDIIPVYIDGFGKVLPKESFHLHPGDMTVEVMPRIRRDDPIWQQGYRGVTHYVHELYLKKRQ